MDPRSATPGPRAIAALLCSLPLGIAAPPTPAAPSQPYYAKRATWWDTVRASRGPLVRYLQEDPRGSDKAAVEATWQAFWGRLREDFPEAEADGLSACLRDAAGVSAGQPALAFHVAVDGDDRASGSAPQPFASIHRARDAVRELKKRTGGLPGPVEIIVHGGTHYLDGVIRLGPEDSGTADCPIVYRAAEGEDVVLSAGRVVRTPWHRGEDGVYSTDIPEARDTLNFGPQPAPLVIRYDDPSRVARVGHWVRGVDWIHDGDTGKGEKRVVFDLSGVATGTYRLYSRWVPFGNRAREIPVRVTHADGATETMIDQTRPGDPALLGRFRFEEDTAGQVEFANDGTNGYVAVHRVELVEAEEDEPSAPWAFRQLFVNGQRATLARYPNADPSDVLRKGWLYAGTRNEILAGLGQKGDWMEFAFRVPKAGRYALWVGVATVFDDPHEALALSIDGRTVPLLPMAKSGGWRQVVYSKAAVVELAGGDHAMRWESAAPVVADEAKEIRVHLDAFVFSNATAEAVGTDGWTSPLTPGETRIVVQAEDDEARVGGESRMTFMKFHVGPTLLDRVPCAPGTVKAGWTTAPHAEVFMFPTWGWFNSTTWIDKVVRTGPVWTGVGEQIHHEEIHIRGREARTKIWPWNRFYVFNLLCELDAPGEWYLDYPTGRLHYRPREGEAMEAALAVAPALHRIFELRAPSEGGARVEHVAIRGFAFRHTDYTSDHPAWRSSEDCAVLLENAWHCAVEDCTFADTGGYAIRLSLDSCLNRIAGNTVTRAGAGGIILRGPWVGWGRNRLSTEPGADTLAPIGNLITRNHVHHCGVFKKYVAGVHFETRPETMAYAPGNVISHNLIHHMPRNGIFGFRCNGGYVIEHNHIHDVLQESDDGGLIHICTGKLNGTAPTVVRNNLLHDVTAYRYDDEPKGRTGLAAASNGHGVYLDGHTSHVRVERNVISGTRKGCVFIHDGENNLVRNNILLDDRRQQIWHTGTGTGNRFVSNVVRWAGESPWYASVRPPKGGEWPNGGPAFERNLIWHRDGAVEVEGQGTFGEWQANGFDAGSVLADPGLDGFDLSERRCPLRPESPAFRVGFRPIDLSRVGPGE